MTEPTLARNAATLRAILLMIGAMAAFTVTDAFIKLVSARLSIGQILSIVGCLGAVGFAIASARAGEPVVDALFFHRVIVLRNAAEVVGTLGFVTALALVPLSLATAIQQATPLVITVGAAVVLRETVGPWRWGAVIAGFGGVLLILRPGLNGFDANALWALLAVLGLGIRDLTTRFLPPGTGTARLAAWAFGCICLTGIGLTLATGDIVRPTLREAALLVAIVLSAMAGYILITASLRGGDVSAVAPYRYSRIVFALVIAVIFLGERPDLTTLTGAAIIVAAGLVILWRETRRSR